MTKKMKLYKLYSNIIKRFNDEIYLVIAKKFYNSSKVKEIINIIMTNNNMNQLNLI